ncbi:tyrosine-type recombinase/integrase [Tissierella sp.]|uniref:tyrosine-type recombinase/integrase n=1 Tax=Tissierella sp. TaxID=41274 RepID=UPI0028AF54B5|nr:tyrosine-type recombinase/integrase [Tissierella sp.]
MALLYKSIKNISLRKEVIFVSKTRVEYYPEELEQLLDKHLEIESLKKQQLEVENNLIFTGITGGFISKKTISDWFRRFLIRNKLKRITFHGLRHTSATMLLASDNLLRMLQSD